MTGSDDVIATLSTRVSELAKRVALLQAELEGANRRVAVYEEHDGTIQDAVSGALRAAYTIRERAETTAAQILEQAREERRLLLKEIERLRDERDNLQDEIATQRRSGLTAIAPRPLSSDSVATELRAVAGEALRGLFQEIVDDMRAAPRAAAPAPPVAPAAPRPQAARPAPFIEEDETPAPRIAPAPRSAPEPRVAPPQRSEPAARVEAAPPIAPAQPEPTRLAPSEPVRAEPVRAEPEVEPMRAEPREPEPAHAEAEPEPAPTYEYMSRIRRAAVEAVETVPAASAHVDETEVAPSAPMDETEVAPMDETEVAPMDETEVAPSASAATSWTASEAVDAATSWAASEAVDVAAPPPLEVVPPVETFEIAPSRVEAATPTSDIQVVLSPVASFPRLVEIERRIQALPVVRTLYVRDFRGGAATLAVALRSAMTPDEFAGMLAGLQQPRLRLVSGSRNTIELRIEGEAGVA